MMSTDSRRGSRSAPAHALVRKFTLIELLVVIAIISILLSMLIPLMSKARGKGRTASSMNNMKQIYLMAASYADDYDGSLCLTVFNPYPGFPVGPDHGANWHRMVYENMFGMQFSENFAEAREQMRDSSFVPLMTCPYLLALRGSFPESQQGHGHYSWNHYFTPDYKEAFDGRSGNREPFMAGGTQRNATTTRSDAQLQRSTLDETRYSMSYEYPGVVGLAAFIDGHVSSLSVSEGTALTTEIEDRTDFQ